VSTKSTIAEHRTSILIAIIAFVGAITPILVTSFSNWASNMPIVDPDMILYNNSNTNSEEAEITLTNIGFGPATNITLIVYAPKLDGVINIGSTAQVELPITSQTDPIRYDGTRIEAHIPKLVTGSGSFVKLKLFLARNQTISSDGYPAYVTYDQGSDTRTFFLNIDDPLTGIYNGYNNALPYGNILLIPVILFGLFIFLYIRLLQVRKKRKQLMEKLKGHFISGVIDDLIHIRRVLKIDSKHQQPLPNLWRIGGDYKFMLDYLDYIKAKEIQDYIILEDIFVALEDRNQSLSSISDYRLEMLNKNLLYLANNALEKINWKKYPR